jgi:hypothetical protein
MIDKIINVVPILSEKYIKNNIPIIIKIENLTKYHF